MPDPYQTLGVPRDATPDQIRGAYRRLARELHPDVSPLPDAAARFAAVAEAYELLTDPARSFSTPAPDPSGDDPEEAAEVYDAYFRREARASAATRRTPPPYQPISGTLDLVLDLPISVHEAAEGAALTVPSPDGARQVTIPAGCCSGREIRLTGAGARTRAGRRGDLIVRVRIVPGSGAGLDDGPGSPVSPRG
ncbi:MAG: DnaJ domain-containing protein [Phycisphaerales bacterium]|nr:DnaJ domain-containing protein [Planctomycetota bacterium]MCH8507238.1 DnaJ domain-containing protein [Phycisphaerales bacterium]